MTIEHFAQMIIRRDISLVTGKSGDTAVARATAAAERRAQAPGKSPGTSGLCAGLLADPVPGEFGPRARAAFVARERAAVRTVHFNMRRAAEAVAFHARFERFDLGLHFPGAVAGDLHVHVAGMVHAHDTHGPAAAVVDGSSAASKLAAIRAHVEIDFDDGVFAGAGRSWITGLRWRPAATRRSGPVGSFAARSTVGSPKCADGQSRYDECVRSAELTALPSRLQVLGHRVGGLGT